MRQVEDFKVQCYMNIINSLLAGALVFAGAFANGGLSRQGIIMALSASAIVAISKFREFWSKTMVGKRDLQLFNFV